MTYPDGTLATYEYDDPGRRTRSTDPATGVSTTSYDNNGNPLVATRASGQQITNTYDSLNRPLSITGAPNTASTPVPLATYTYDTAIGGKGHPAAATTHTATGDFTTATAAYNQHGAPTQTSHTYPTPGTGTPTTLTYTTTYDTTGRVSSATLPSVGGLPAETLTYGYADTSTGLPTTMAGQRTYVSATNYLPDGTIAGRSFAGATVVLMADGTKKPIEDVKVGDKVLATDPETGEQVAKQVEHVFVHDDTVTDLVVDGEVISTTEDHPFSSVTDGRFERADHLSSGEDVLDADGKPLRVSGLKVQPARQALAYNLALEGIHTYHVGAAAILVHIRATWMLMVSSMSWLGTRRAASRWTRRLGWSITGSTWPGWLVVRLGRSANATQRTEISNTWWAPRASLVLLEVRTACPPRQSRSCETPMASWS